MKQTIFYSIIAVLATIFSACNDEWEDEQYKKYVAFVRSGYTEINLNSNVADGVIHYKIPIIISGSTGNDRDVTVTVALDRDTLDDYNIAMYYKRNDLFFRLLEEKHYDFPNGTTVTIPAGENVGCLDIDFKIKEENELDLVEKYILPLQIVSTSEYLPSPHKWYKKSLMRIIPFNYFSGTYAAGAALITAEGSSESTSVESREMRVVNDSAVFFYAGLCEENARDRATYKVRVQFNDDHSLTFSADSAKINFEANPEKCKWSLKEEMDALQPYLMIRTINMELQYSYEDVTNPDYKVKYTLKGFYTLERRRNIQIPEEDQQVIFDW
ncbi:MAG: DUF4973 domain-containing protein [Tannerella sp.]|jgi:hypothetical protein|nr:DUF4973 domain-containing protein [Tannerella sp.]